MSFLTIALMGEDQLLRLRIAACAAQEGAARDGVDPDHWAAVWRRDWASAPNWDTTWESALASGVPSTEIGGRADVITDGMILSAVQPMKPFRLVGEVPRSASTVLAEPLTLTDQSQDVLTLDIPGPGVWGISGTWTGTSISTSLILRAGDQELRVEPKDSLDRNPVSLGGYTDGPTTLTVEAEKSSMAGVFVVSSLTMWWLAAS